MTAFETTAYAVVMADEWRKIVETWPHHYDEAWRPYRPNGYAVFNGRYVVVIETIGM